MKLSIELSEYAESFKNLNLELNLIIRIMSIGISFYC